MMRKALRCFDLLGSVGNTGCLALAMLNREGLTAGCEGDVPTMLFAHCTIPLDMVRSYRYDTHFESGIGVAVKGEVEEGDVTVFKLSGDMKRAFVCEGRLEKNLCEKDLCRTQLLLSSDAGLEYFFSDPIGNHHVILKGHRASLIKSFLSFVGVTDVLS